MLWFRKFFKFYLDASIHVALAVVALYWLSIQNLNTLPNYAYLFFLFFSTIVCYNFIKYGVEAKKYLIVTKPYHKSIQLFSFLAFAVALVFFVQLARALWAPIVVLTLLSALYAIPFLPNAKNLRSLGAWKILLVAVVWTGLTVWLPQIDSGMAVDSAFYGVLVQRFLLVVVLMLPFEIRDVYMDPKDLGTLPQLFGVDATKCLGYVLVVVYAVLELATQAINAQAIARLVLLLGCLSFVLYRSSVNQNRYFSAFWVEGIPLFMLFLEYAL